MARRNDAIGLLAVLATHAALLAWSAYWHSPVVDEVGHLPAGISHWRFQRFDLYAVNPPLVRGVAVIPVLFAGFDEDWSAYSEVVRRRSEFALGRNFAEANADRFLWAWRLARWMCIPFSLLGGVVCYLWARDVFGRRAALGALLMWCASPTILGHASLITPDAPAAALGVATCYLFRRWLCAPSWGRALLAGLLLGMTELTKFTWLVLYPVLTTLWLTWRCFPRGESSMPMRRQAAQLLTAFLLSLYVINLGYAFEGSFTRLGEFNFSSRALSGRTENSALGGQGNRFRDTWLARAPVPLPRNMLLGIDHIKYEYEAKYWSYLRGERRHGGWWHYYVTAMLVKMSTGTLCLLGLSLVAISRSQWRPAPWREQVCLLLPAVVVIALVSSQTGFNHHMRYVLPAFPFLFLFASQALTAAAAWGRTAGLSAVACLLWGTVSSLSNYPHSLSYFNEPSGGARRGGEWLNGSNIDWGQDLLYLKAWQESNAKKTPLRVDVRNLLRPSLYGITVADRDGNRHGGNDGGSDGGDRRRAASVDQHRPPEWIAIGIDRLLDQDSGLAFDLDDEPEDSVAYSLRIYRRETVSPPPTGQ